MSEETIQDLPEETVENTAVESVTEVIETPAVPKKQGYENRTARLLNRVYIGLLIATVGYLGFQGYLSVTSYLGQMAQYGMADGSGLAPALLYTFASILMPAILLVGMSFLFKFFAEVVELLHHNSQAK